LKVLVTGGCGFIGANFVRHLLDEGYDVVNLDLLTYSGRRENLEDVEDHPRYRFCHGDICDRTLVAEILDAQGIEAILNFAAESHVDRSILDASAFIRTNIGGTHVLLEEARRREIPRFVQVSTDEVYGDLGPTGAFTEESPIQPNSPYSASKAAADLLVRAYWRTFGLPVLITRSSNNYGPYQFPEKLIPLMITNALEDKPLPVYGDGKNVRDWLYVADNCRAIRLVLEKGTPGEVYNIGGGEERQNIEIVQAILRILQKPDSLITYVTDRPGHDRRYALEIEKMRAALGWNPEHRLEGGLEKTVHWYLENRAWWQGIRDESFEDYYRRQYGEGRREGQG
jgi:dTDP-glucose 4,6-dehydratase